jgi:HEPN domain-containing protein
LSKSIANVLLTKSAHDYNAAKHFVNVEPALVGDHVFGLLLQQSVEKAVKALTLDHRLKYEHIHDIHRLFQILSKKIAIPAEFDILEGLSMYATRERCEAPLAEQHIDRGALIELTRRFLEWADKQRVP